MANEYVYKVYCETDSKWEEITQAAKEPSPAETCPVDGGHTVTASSLHYFCYRTAAGIILVEHCHDSVDSKYDNTASGLAANQVQAAVDELNTDIGGKEPSFSKNTAFNKDFGSGSGDSCEGNDARLSDSRTPTAHTIASHSDTGATGTELDTLTDGSNADALHTHAGGGSITMVFKGTDETLASSTVLQDDNDLKFALLNGETWAFRLTLIASEAANNPNLKLRMAATLGLTGTIEYCWYLIGSSASGHLSDFTTDSGIINLTTSKQSVVVTGSVKATANGTLHLQWAQYTSDADVTTIHALSKLEASK